MSILNKTIIYIFIILTMGWVSFVGRTLLVNKKNDFKSLYIMELSSSAFKHNQKIPLKYSCDGDNINPPLSIREVPDGAKSLVLIMDDPDATGGGTFDHWIIWNISPDTMEIEEGIVPPDSVQGRNGFGDNAYGGPCPPKGNSPHRYVFKLFALDIKLDLPAGLSKLETQEAIENHLLGAAKLIGLYGR